MATNKETSFAAIASKASSVIVKYMPGCCDFKSLPCEIVDELCIRARSLPRECPSKDIIGSVLVGKQYLIPSFDDAALMISRGEELILMQLPPCGDATLAMSNSAGDGFGSSPLTSLAMSNSAGEGLGTLPLPSCDDAANAMNNSAGDEKNDYSLYDFLFEEVISMIEREHSSCTMCLECQIRYKAAIFLEACKIFDRGSYLYEDILPVLFTFCKIHFIMEQSMFSIEHRIDPTFFDNLVKQLLGKFSELKRDFLSSLGDITKTIKENISVILCGALGLTMGALLVFKVSQYAIDLITRIVKLILVCALPDQLYNFIVGETANETNTVAAIKAQAGTSDIADDEPLWRLIIKLFMCAAVGCTPLVTSYCFSGEIWKNIITIFKNRSITEALKAVVDYLFGYFNIPFNFSHAIPNAVESAVIELLNITRYLKSKDMHFHPLSDTDFIRCSRACDVYNNYVAKFTTNKSVSDYLHNYRTHYDFVHSACVNYNKTKIRMEPVVITLYGEPGVGKTCSLNTLIGALAGEVYGNKYDSSILTYTRNPAQDFWDGYDGQPFVLYDDLFQLKDSETNPNPEVNDIIRCVNTNSFNLNMADLASKGVTYFVSEWIIATSNVNNLQTIKSVHSAKAVGRRLQLNYEMTLNIEFPTPEGDTNCVEYLNRLYHEYTAVSPRPSDAMVDRYMMDMRNSLWNFTEFNWNDSTEIGRTLTFEEVLQTAFQLYKRKKALVTSSRPHIPKGIFSKVEPQAGIFTQSWKDIYNADSTSNGVKFGHGRTNGINVIERNFVHDFLLDTLPALYIDTTYSAEHIIIDLYLEALMRNCIKADDFIMIDMHTSSDMELPEIPLADPFHLEAVSNIQMEFLVDRNMENVFYTTFLRRLAISLNKFKFQKMPLSLFYTTLSEVIDKEIWNRLKKIHSKFFGVVLFIKIAIASVAIYSGIKVAGKLLRGGASVAKKAVALITRKDAALSIAKIVPQGSTMSGENVIKYMISRMKRNMLRFIVETKGSFFEQGYAVIPKTGVIIFPAHFIHNFSKYSCTDPDARVIFTRLPTDPTADEEMYPYYISAQEMHETKPYIRVVDGVSYATDLVVKKATTLEHHDITEQFLPVSSSAEGKIALLETAATVHIMVKPDKTQPLLRLSTVGLRPKYHRALPNYTKAVEGKTLSSYVAYNLATYSGDCGGLVMFTTTQGFKLGGIHTAADIATKNALCAVIFQEDFCNISQTTLTVSSDLIEQGMKIRETAIAPYFSSNIEPYSREMLPPYKQPMLFKPSRMSVFTNSNGEKVSPMKRATARYQQLHATYDLSSNEPFFIDVQKKIVPFESYDHIYDRVWSFEEAVVGVPGISYMDACNRTTSSGYKYMKLSPNGKKGFFGDSSLYDLTTPNCQILKKDVVNIIECAKKNIRLEHIFRDCLKDELLKPSKVENGDTRLFNTGPLDLQLATKMYFGAFNKMLHNNRIELGISIGINPHVEWKFLYEHLTCRFANAFAGDFSGYDYTTTSRIFEMCLEIIDSWYRFHDPMYEESHTLIRRILFAEVYNSLHIGMDGTYYWLGNNSSGHASTADNNSLYNLLLFAYCARKLTGKSLYDISDFCIYGDDNIFVTNHPEFNLENCAVALKRFGLSYGPDTKDGSMYKWKPLLECLFLKRSFRPEFGYVFSPLELTSITKTLYFKHKGETDMERYLKYYTRLLELSQHTFDIFYEYGRFLIAECIRCPDILDLCPSLLKPPRELYYSLQETCRQEDFSISEVA